MGGEKKHDLRVARNVLGGEVQYRRDKLWKIFSWTSSLLVAMIAGEATVSASDTLNLPFWPMGVAALVAVAVLMVYSLGWIGQNLKIQSQAEREIEAIDGDLGIPVIKPKLPVFGYRLTIVLLALTAAGGLLLTVQY
jgi:hypothetical protein